MNPDTNYKTASGLPIFMGTSCNSQNIDQNQEPKLENFLGGHSFGNHEHKLNGCNTVYDTTGEYVFQNCSLQLPSEATSNERIRSNGGGENKNSSIGLSMIKTWLRNQPAPTQQDTSNKNNGSAQSLSLSMSTGSQSAASSLPLLAVTGGGNNTGGDHSSSSDNNKEQKTTPSLDSQTVALEAVPRKSIDTFGQRTSIYRGVTRYFCTIHQVLYFSLLYFSVLLLFSR